MFAGVHFISGAAVGNLAVPSSHQPRFAWQRFFRKKPFTLIAAFIFSLFSHSIDALPHLEYNFTEWWSWLVLCCDFLTLAVILKITLGAKTFSSTRRCVIILGMVGASLPDFVWIFQRATGTEWQWVLSIIALHDFIHTTVRSGVGWQIIVYGLSWLIFLFGS